MTREEAIEILRNNRPTSDPRPCGMELCDAVDMAISALMEQETVTNRNGLNEPLTNAQKIRSMTDEELAEFLWDFNLADVSTGKIGEFGPHMFRYRLKEWLQQPCGGGE